MPARKLKWEEVEQGKEFRLKIVKWSHYQEDLKGGQFSFVKIAVLRPLDTMLQEPLNVRGLFWELLRAAGASRRPGWVVAGANEPLTLTTLAWFLRLDPEEIKKPLQRLYETGRVEFWTGVEQETSDNIHRHPESSEIISNHSKSFSASQNHHNKKRGEERRREERRGDNNICRADDVHHQHGTPSFIIRFRSQLTQETINTFQKTFPHLNVQQEINKMEAWLVANPTRAARYKNFRRFALNWLKRQAEAAKANDPILRLEQKLATLNNPDVLEKLRANDINSPEEYKQALEDWVEDLADALKEISTPLPPPDSDAYKRWFAEQALEIIRLDESLDFSLQYGDYALVLRYIKSPACRFAIGSARDLRLKWHTLLAAAKKWRS